MEDAYIIREILSGNRKMFTEIVKKYELPLLRLVSKYVKDVELARDIVQESFFKIYKSLDRYQGRCSFKNWVYKVTLNTAHNKMRSRRIHENIDNTVISIASEVETNLMSKEVRRMLTEVVDALPERQRESVRLRVFQDMSFKQVADVMNCPYDTAKANYRHAMIKIKDVFKKKELLDAV